MSSQMGQFTHRSRESGRLSPVLDETSIDMSDQPSQQHRFNEPLKIRKGRNFVDFKPPSPTVVHVPNRSFAHGRWTNVTVQRKNGRYVVIEQRPVYTQFTDSSTVKRGYQKDLFGPDKSWTKKKAPWSWSTKGSYIGRSVNRGFQEPYLPPMKERYSHVASRVGSMDYADHVPGGGTHKVPSFKLKWEAEAKIGSLPPPTTRSEGAPGLKLPSISPRYGASADSESFTTIHYTPGGNVVLRKQRYLDAKSQVGSLDNVSYSPGGGDISIPQKSIKWKKESKIGSLDNITHLPKSSNVQIFSDKLKWKTEPKVGSLDNAHHIPRTKKFKVPNFKQDWGKAVASRVDSLSNVEHTPRGGNVQIIDVPKKWKGKSKIDSKWKFNYDYKSLFGDDYDEVDRQTFSNASSYPYTVCMQQKTYVESK
ncbi:MTAP2-like protein [Mya arenaria]|uniref:MTAP2-like protein n=1 Tax=Mya arenaria TaxID=6604 RepID=A0ABY7E5Y1_MYAAR|nr:MTAP2-like protein [Mya arenaria]